MSASDKRQARQRALTVGACAAVFAFGGPLVAQRFSDQKIQEAFINEAAVLAESIVAEGGIQTASLSTGLFTNRAPAGAVLENAPLSFTDEGAVADLVGGLTLRAKDSAAIRGLVDFTLEDLDRYAGADKQLDCLSRAIYYEARSEGTAGQMAVAEVVMNRVRDPRFPATICGVVYQGQYRDTGCQFTFTCDGSIRHKPRGPAWDRARDIALHVMLGLNTPVTNKATHYHTNYVDPYWAPGLVKTARIGTHIFYRFPKTTQEWVSARSRLDVRRQQDRAYEPELVSADSNAGSLDDVPAEALASLITVSVDAAEVPPVVRAPATAAIEQRPL